MQPFIDYIGDGGLWTWIAFGAGALGILSFISALFATYKRPGGVFAAEMGLLAILAGGVGWGVARSNAEDALVQAREKLAPPPQRSDRPRDTAARSALAEDVLGRAEVEVARLVKIPLRVGLGSGVPPLVLGLILVMVVDRR